MSRLDALKLAVLLEYADHEDLWSNGYVLHKQFGAYTQRWAWHVSKIDDRGVLQGFVADETPAKAIQLALREFTRRSQSPTKANGGDVE